MANKKLQGSLTKLERLPNIYYTATKIFADNDDFMRFVNTARAKQEEIKKRIKLTRSNDRMLQNYSYLYAMLDRL